MSQPFFKVSEKDVLILDGETCWKAVDGDLSTLGKLKAQVTKLLNEDKSNLHGHCSFNNVYFLLTFSSSVLKASLTPCSSSYLREV